MRKTRSSISPSGLWLYGFHPVKAALLNPQRQKLRLLVKDEKTLFSLPKLPPKLQPEIVDKTIFQNILGTDAVHQGIALLTAPLPSIMLEDMIENMPHPALVVILDGVTDPHNVGAILRSAAAFGARAVITTAQHSPAEESAVLAKTASGALEEIPLIRVTNLARAIHFLQSQEFWVYGLDESGENAICHFQFSDRTALVFGAEGEGLRRLTRETCDGLIHLPTSAHFGTLNVSTSVAVSLYEWQRQQIGKKL